MGILKNLNLSNGLEVSQAYGRIERIVVEKEKAEICMVYYVNKEMAENQKISIKTSYYTFEPSKEESGLNIIKEGYLFLKSLEGFDEVEDVLEDGQEAFFDHNDN